MKVIFFPGVAVYALCTVVGSFLSLTSIDKVDFFLDKAPFVRRGTTRIPYFGHLLSAFATHLPLLVIFFYAHTVLPVPDWGDLCLPSFASCTGDPGELLEYFGGVGANTPVGAPAFWIVCYVILGLVLSFDLRLQELLATAILTMLACWVCGILSWLGVGFSFLSRGWFMSHLYLQEWLGIASGYLLATAAGVFLLLAGRAGGRVGASLIARRYAQGQISAKGRGAKRKHGELSKV